MGINSREINGAGIRFSITLKDKEVGRAYLYVFKNDLQEQPVQNHNNYKVVLFS